MGRSLPATSIKSSAAGTLGSTQRVESTMKDYLVLLVFNINGVTIMPSFHRSENENAALARALTLSEHPVKFMTSQSVQEVHSDFCVLNSGYDVIASKDVIAMSVEGIKKNSDLTQDMIRLAKKYNFGGVTEALKTS